MKDLNMLVWMTQLGLSTALPPAILCPLGVWLHRCKDWGLWTVWVGLILGLTFAATGFRNSLKAMERMAGRSSPEPPPPAFSDHV